MTISKKRLKELANIQDGKIDTSEIPELGDDFWKEAKLVMPEGKKVSISLRVDPDVLKFFKESGRGYQSRMNAVLKAYKNAHP